MSHMDMNAAERQKRHGRAIIWAVCSHSRLDDATIRTEKLNADLMGKRRQLLLVERESSSIPSSRIDRCEAQARVAPDGKDGISNQLFGTCGRLSCSRGDDSLEKILYNMNVFGAAESHLWRLRIDCAKMLLPLTMEIMWRVGGVHRQTTWCGVETGNRTLLETDARSEGGRRLGSRQQGSYAYLLHVYTSIATSSHD